MEIREKRILFKERLNQPEIKDLVVKAFNKCGRERWFKLWIIKKVAAAANIPIANGPEVGDLGDNWIVVGDFTKNLLNSIEHWNNIRRFG